jgi:hypothetical protein
MKIRKEKKKKLEENRIMGEDPEYEYEWNNFVIVQVIDLDDDEAEQIEESGVEAQKKEVHYSNLLDELTTKNNPNMTQKPKRNQNPVNANEKPRVVNTAGNDEKAEGSTMYYKCPICFKKILAKDFNEHYKEELKSQQMQKEEKDVKKIEEEVPMQNKVQTYLNDRKNKKNNEEIVFKKKNKPDFLK